MKEIIKIKNYCKNKGIKFFLSNNIKLSIKLNLNGAYIPSYNKSFKHLSYLFKKEFELIGSAHNLKEIQIKKIQQADEILLSPVFKKKNINALGLYKLKHFFESFKKDKIALGGINSTNIKLIKLVNFRGFAAIDYFERQKKRPQKNWGL